jgi:hypothetical protein
MKSQMSGGVMIIAAASILLAGCTSGQLDYNTLDLASSSDDLLTAQILSNLSKFRSSPYAIPSQVSIPSGSASTTNTITSNFIGPLGAAGTATLINTVAAPPLEDPDQLRRLRALYRFGAKLTGKAGPNSLACEYPLVQQAQGNVTQLDGSNPPSRQEYNKPEGCPSDYVVGTPDPAFLKPPGCIICNYDANRDKGSPQGQVDKVIQFYGIFSSGSNIIDIIYFVVDGAKYLPTVTDIPLEVVGKAITGMCIPSSATITSIDSKTQIEISNATTCSKELNLSGKPNLYATFALPPKPQKQQKHTLEVNRLLSNDWVIYGDERTPGGAAFSGQEPATPLGHGANNIYLRPGLEYNKYFSDFVLFVLEATLQGTPAAGTSGKGTPQKAGAPSALQAPASAAVTIVQ